ncbi:MAG: hypothetical protein KatS3mg105_2929 [Gemmatales bacterium]|nr:MAG: hypothetical protein KatS3mg105_2929 [Gemmatales bacterium]
MVDKEQIEHASLTDVGVKRGHNQDNLAVMPAATQEQWQAHGHVFLVADGMGAHAVGELASELAANIIPLTYQKYSSEGTYSAIERAFLEANASIHDRGLQNRDFKGMGTTSSALILRPEGAWVGHVGDSRVYRIRDGFIEQLSYDHSLVWELARRQGISPDVMQGVPSNVIVRSLGPDSKVEPDISGPHPIRAGDVYVLCSDGLSGPVADHEIGAVASSLPPKEACRFLVDLANLRGGPDNITVIVVKVKCDAAADLDDLTPPQPWYQRFPWPLLSLLLGFVFAGTAVFLTANKANGGIACFILALICILGGIAGLVINLMLEKKKPPPKPRKTRLKGYNKTICKVDRELLDELLYIEDVVERFIRQEKWETDWHTFAEHRQQAESYLQQGDLASAYREYCLALLPLTNTLQEHRKKGESFQPHWNKSG